MIRSLPTAGRTASVPGSGLDRDAARQAAQHELSRGIYHTNEPGLPERLLAAVLSWFGRFLDRVAAVTPGGGYGLLLLAIVFGVLVWFALWRSGPAQRQARRGRGLLDPTHARSAAEHRRHADEHAAAGRHADAVRDLMRAVVRELELRGVLEPQAGRTADEAARDAGRQVPAAAPALSTAAATFDELWYGRRPATAAHVETMRAADAAVQRVLQGGAPAVAPTLPDPLADPARTPAPAGAGR
jgi:hypothetical protein